MNFASHPFTLRQLQYFVAVAEALSFRGAAELCGVSQPSLSAQIAQLEDVLGAQLFERDRRRVLVSPAGKQLLPRARHLLRDADEFLRAAATADPLGGTVRIGVIPTISPYLLPPVAPALRLAHPEMRALWREDKTEVLVRALDDGNLDLAILALEAEIGDVDYEVLARDPFLLAAKPGHPLSACTGPAALWDLADADVLLLDDGHCFRDQALAFCASAEATELAFRATSLATLAQMVAAGLGVTLLPQLAVSTELQRAELAIRSFVEPSPGRTLILAWRASSPFVESWRALAASLRAAWPTAGCVEPK